MTITRPAACKSLLDATKSQGNIRDDSPRHITLELERADLDAERKQITEEELEAARDRQEDLKTQIARCQSLLQESRNWVGFEAVPFREALSCSLELLGGEPLAETTDEEGRRVWTFPPLDRRAVTDPRALVPGTSRDIRTPARDARRECPCP